MPSTTTPCTSLTTTAAGHTALLAAPSDSAQPQPGHDSPAPSPSTEPTGGAGTSGGAGIGGTAGTGRDVDDDAPADTPRTPPQRDAG